MLKSRRLRLRRNPIYGRDPREIPTYSIREAAGYLFIPESTLKAWVVPRTISAGALIELPDEDAHLLSFVNLVEAHVLKVIRFRHGVSMSRVRRALAYLRTQLETTHPLIEARLKTDNINLFMEEGGTLVNLSMGGQLALKDIVAALLERIEHDEQGIAVRLYPFLRRTLTSPSSVVIDPFVSFGKPVIRGTGVRTAVIAERYLAGDSIDFLADDYSLDRASVEEAIRYETNQQRAA